MALISSTVLTISLFSSMLSLLLFASRVQAIVSSTYALDTEYSGSTFFDGFEFWTDPDPTHGFVSYQSQSSSLSKGLISTTNNVARMSVDASTVLGSDGLGGGRESVRISSKKRFTHGLFLADLKHMPGSECGVWPAYWMFGPEWPNGGEIDIIEGVSLQQRNVMTLHTGDTCSIAGSQSLGTLQTNDCNQNNGFGCSISSSSSTSYGDPFNSANGGVSATQWTSDYIRIWYFPRSSIPNDIVAGKPDPSSWGLPDGNFQGNCDVDANFADHQIVFDTTFCGDWAGSVWSSDPVCSEKANTCAEYVAGNPEAFTDAYWDINYVKVFTLAEEPIPSSTLAAPSFTSTSTSIHVTLSPTSKSTSQTGTSSSASKSTSTLTSSSPTSRSTSPSRSISTSTQISSSSSKSSSITHSISLGQYSTNSIVVDIPSMSALEPKSTSCLTNCISASTVTPKLTATTNLTTTANTSSLQSPTPRPSSLAPFPTTPQNITIPRPATIRGWSYIGCLSSTSFPSFILSATNENMTGIICASRCSTSAYFGTFGTSCFCGSDLLDTTILSDSACTILCPGSPSQVCGGLQVNSRSSKRSEFQYQHKQMEEPVGLEKRQGAVFLLTVYQNDLFLPESLSLSFSPTPDPSEVHFAPSTGEIPTPSITLIPVSTLIGVPMGVSESDSVEPITSPSGVHFAPVGTNTNVKTVTSSVSAAMSLIGIGMGGALVNPTTATTTKQINIETTITTVLTATYTDVCHCAESTLQVYTTTSTLIYTDCGCSATAHLLSMSAPHTLKPQMKTVPQIPMTTQTRICADCGMDGTVIVTVPCAETSAPFLLPAVSRQAHKAMTAENAGHPLTTTSPKIPNAPLSAFAAPPAIELAKSTETQAKIETLTTSPPNVPVPVLGNASRIGNQTLVLSNTGEALRWQQQWKWGVCFVLGMVGVGGLVH
ncbi:hypothetical protein BKA64DRAFT_628733 [Cadophora sp. MPI-SDFR-AT-0126]|nr:hypothetical protein BKA64DRAFT_628733 [Leotiomycetes sp. MPI-SDFR-AT-0126]